MARGHVWKFILVPFAYGIAGPAGILIGTNIGAGQGGRALRTAWITLLLSVLAIEAIGLAAATRPAAWIGSFSGHAAVLAIGTTYLRTVGPFFGFFAMGYALYCVGQGMGRMGWPVAGGVIRAAIAVTGGAAAIRLGANLDHVFMAVSLGMMSFGLLSLPSLFHRSAYGTWHRSSAARGPTAVCTR
jgi:Na+-driven multidrug efflux pump